MCMLSQRPLQHRILSVLVNPIGCACYFYIYLMFSSLHTFYCLILSAGFLLQFDRNSLPSTTVLHSDGQLHCTAALQTMEGLNRYCLKAGQGKRLIIFLLMIQLPTGPPRDYSAAWSVQMAPVAACNKDPDVEQKGRGCINRTREGKAVS